MFGVPVPRKARSASVKRSHESWTAGNGGFGDGQNHWQASKSLSPASRNAESERVSNSSSNASARKKMKTNGPKSRISKVSKPSNSVQEDIEIEIAEVLYGLMKQSQSSKKEDTTGASSQKLDCRDENGIHDTKPSVSSPVANSVQPTSPVSDSLIGVAQKKKAEAEISSTSAQNSSIMSTVKAESEQPAKMEISSPYFGKASRFKVESCEAHLDKDALNTASGLLESRESLVVNQDDSKPSTEEPTCVDGAVAKEKSVSTEEESAELDVDFQDSAVIKGILVVSDVEGQREEKFKIDLMAPPPMVSSPERDDLVDLTSDLKHESPDTEMMDATVKDEKKAVNKEVGLEDAEEKVGRVRVKGESLKHDLEKHHRDGGSDSCSRLEQHGQKQQLSKPSIPRVEKTAPSSSPNLPMTVAGWPNGLPSMGYLPPLPTIAPMDGSTGSSAGSQPRPKRCALHHYIARNIHLHQQFTKMNHFWPAPAGSVTLSGAKPNNLNAMPSAENLIPGNPFQGTFPVVNLNSTERGQVVTNFPGLTRKDKSSESTKFMDAAQRKQVVLQQAAQAVPSGNLVQGPAFIFPMNHHQTAAATTNQTGASQSASITSKAPMYNSSAPTGSLALSGVAPTVCFNYPNLGVNETSYPTVLHNNGYPFAIPALVGKPPAMRGGAAAQPLPFFTGSYYSSQLYHSQIQHQHPAYQKASTSSGSSSSHKQQPETHPRGAQLSGNNILSSASMHSQQLQQYHKVPSHQSHKLETEMSGENTALGADMRALHLQKSVYGQNSNFLPQPLNFTLVPSKTAVGSNSSGNHCQKQQQSQQKSSRGGVEIIPSQAFAMSFASFSGNNVASNFNFSSMAQNPAVFHNLPDVNRQGYPVASEPQATQQKNHQITDGKSGGGSSNLDDGKKASSGKSQTTHGQTLVFDNSARLLNFVSSPVIGNWPPPSTASTALSTNPPVIVSSSNSQQQPITAARTKAQTTNTLPASSIAAKFSNNATIFPQNLAQSTQWRNPTKTTTSLVPATSLGNNVPNGKNLSQQPVRASQGQTQISFGANSNSALSTQGQEASTSSQSESPVLIVGSPTTGGYLRTSSTSSKAGSSVPTLQPQQSDNSSTRTGQKSSPVCGRNVPSILSTCPSHFSELKY